MTHSSVARTIIKIGIIAVFLQIFGVSRLMAEEAMDRYQIEFILFKQASPDNSVLEYERVASPLSPSKTHLNLNSYSEYAIATNQRPKLKPEQEHALAQTEQRLQKQGYEILAKGSWIEPMSKDSRSLPLRLTSARSDYNYPFWYNEYQISSLEQGDIDQAESVESNAQDGLQEHFYGELVIRRSRYMHAELRLDYYFQKPVYYQNITDYLFTPFHERQAFITLLIPSMLDDVEGLDYDETNSTLATVKSFTFKQSRRIKNAEVHYLDHPYMGMIITINRVKESEVL